MPIHIDICRESMLYFRLVVVIVLHYLHFFLNQCLYQIVYVPYNVRSLLDFLDHIAQITKRYKDAKSKSKGENKTKVKCDILIKKDVIDIRHVFNVFYILS